MTPMLEIAGSASCNLPRTRRIRLVWIVVTVGCRMSALEGLVSLATGVSPWIGLPLLPLRTKPGMGDTK